LDKIQPDMIALDPEFVGSLAPPSKLTTSDGKPSADIPFARLPRLERLRVQGKADLTEVSIDDDDEGEAEAEGPPDGKQQSREEREKRKMRGKGKSLKRYLRKQRKNVIDPTTVAIRAKLEKQKEERRLAKIEAEGQGEIKPSALDRFKRAA